MQRLASDPLPNAVVGHLAPSSFHTIQVPRFDEVALVSGSPEDEGVGPQPTTAPGIRETLWNASVKEIERLAVPGSDWVVDYRREDLVFVPRDEFEARLWTFAYPNMRAPAAAQPSPRAKLRNPNLSDDRRWRLITLGEFHRQRKYYGLQSEKGRISCVRTVDTHRMLRIPLSELRAIAPLFSRMLEPSKSYGPPRPPRSTKLDGVNPPLRGKARRRERAEDGRRAA